MGFCKAEPPGTHFPTGIGLKPILLAGVGLVLRPQIGCLVSAAEAQRNEMVDLPFAAGAAPLRRLDSVFVEDQFSNS